MNITMKRRTFIKTTILGLTGLTLGCTEQESDSVPAVSHELGLWLNIDEDSKITVVVVRTEMGQGVTTSLPMIVAEELEANWEDVGFKVMAELGDYGESMTSGSRTIREHYEKMRGIGATAKEMLIQAAANRWQVDPGTLTAENSTVTHPSMGSLRYGELVEEAALLPVPEDPQLKDPSQFKIIGTSVPRLDSPEHIEGTSTFSTDIVVPDMLYAAVAQSPVFGGDVSNFDALSLDPAVGTIVKITSGIAVVARSYWEAEKALASLDVEFEHPPEMEALDNAAITAQLEAGVELEGAVFQAVGDVDEALDNADDTFTQTYEVPYLAHSPLEPPSCIAQVTSTSCELWVATQAASYALEAAVSVTGLDPSAVTIHSTLVGGAFGRKGEWDFVTLAVEIAKSMPGTPVNVIWSRKEDIQHDFYRPAFMAKFSGAIKDGQVTGWKGTNAGPSIMSRFMPGISPDFMSTLNFKPPYGIPAIKSSSVNVDIGVPVGFWRSIGASQNVFFIESFVDALADQLDQDPLAFRKSLLAGNERAVTVLETVADMANWGAPGVSGAAHGVSFADTNDSLVAQIAEVSVDKNNTENPVTVHKVYCAIDCGLAVHPNTIKAQIEGAVIYGLTAALVGQIDIEGGRVKQSNYHDYRALTLKDSPDVEVEIITGGTGIGGVGESGVPLIAPAVANAIFSLTGEQVTKLPINRFLLS